MKTDGKTGSVNRRWIGAAVVSLFFGFLPCAGAIVIDFEQSSGYAAGALGGNPSGADGTKWTGSSTTGVVVTAGKGSGGSQGAYAAAGAANVGIYKFTLDADDFGETFQGDSSVVAFSLELKWEALSGATSALPSVGRFYLGDDGTNPTSVRILWNDFGEIKIYDGLSNVVMAVNASDSVFQASPGVFYRIEGVADYAAKTFTLSVNGVEQGSFGFYATGTPPSLVAYVTNQNNTHTQFTPWVLDNLEVAAIPEPQLLGLLLAAGAGYAMVRRRK
ncbi:MAG TPA: PEP-CTERM sorting domain-containing protein [Chthoniobacteraceae bacterium]|nr:PEP-CTERM sorting domain-containing protein [Chthoniobacteraceae bacterium]